MKSLRRLLAPLSLMLAIVFSPSVHAQQVVELRSVGAPEMADLMDALFAAFAKSHPEVRKGTPWMHRSDALAIGALMYEQTDIAPMIRDFDRNEVAPYDHQFRGDMMKAPVMIPIAMRGGKPVWIAVNQRPGAPLAAPERVFLSFVLGDAGQAVVAHSTGLAPLPKDFVEQERRRFDAFIATVDPALASYRPITGLRGPISSVGSDGMKALMDRWMIAFVKRQPGVFWGQRWEHLGTLNGFHALLHGLTDLAPMGRELWPQELDAYRSATGKSQPLEIRVARGGYNTPQRTTAQAIFVHASNPVKDISIPQLKAILSDHPSIIRWGQLGLTGDWTDRPIHIYMPPPITPNAMWMQAVVLGRQGWSPHAKAGTITETASAIAADPGAIGFGGFEEGGPGIKPLAVSRAEGQPAITASYESASNGSYPLTRSMFIRLNRPATPQAKAFLRFILSRQGQATIPFSGYFPLSAKEAAVELAKLR